MVILFRRRCTSSDGAAFTYDFQNRLKSKNGTAATLTYDCDGTRVAKTVGGVTTRYLVDELNPTGYSQVLEEVSGGDVKVRYTYGTMVVSQTRNPAGTHQTSFYGYDAHGNITFLTNATGAVTDVFAYDAFGGIITSTGSTPNTRLFAGEELDPDLGLINLRARQYDARTGRFLTIDPVMGTSSSPLSFNRYLYAEGDPANRFDPHGTTAQALARGGGTEYAGMLLIAGALIAPQVTVQLGTDGQYISHTAPLIFAVGEKVTCEFFIAASAFGARPGGIYTFCKKKCLDLYTEMKAFCDAPRSCSMQGDTCATATAKAAAGYGCVSLRTTIQKECFRPGDPGYEGHMDQIAQASEALRNCIKVMSKKCQ